MLWMFYGDELANYQKRTVVPRNPGMKSELCHCPTTAVCEVCIRGENVMMGYMNQEKWDREVWFKTGDIGQWSLNGSLEVIDRRKNLYRHKTISCCSKTYRISIWATSVSWTSVYLGQWPIQPQCGDHIINKDHIAEENSTANEFMVKLNALGFNMDWLMMN